MRNPLRFSLRFKMLLVLLSVITVVVGVITFTMARLFHTDKTAYIHDLTSVIALHTAEETRSLLVGYSERLQVFSRIMYQQDLDQEQKDELLKQLFEDFNEFVAVTLYENGVEQATVYDANTLETAGLSKEALFQYRKDHPPPLATLQVGKAYVENATLSATLPTLVIAIMQPTPGNKTSVAVMAVVRLESLLRLANRSKVFETFLVDGQGILVMHTDPARVVQNTKVDWIPRLKELQQQSSFGTTLEYAQEGVGMVGGFARVEFGGLLAGVQIPKTAAYLTGRELLNDLIGVALGLLIVSALLSLFLARLITRPIERLSQAAREVGSGRFDVQVESKSRDEIGDLGVSFNQMTAELKAREEALQQAQAALVQSEKISAFGQISAGIAHEVKNPLAGILGYTQLSLRKLDKEDPLRKNLEIIEKETRRCKTIIDNLMKFARQEKVLMEPMDLNQAVEDAIVIVAHQLGINEIALEKDLAPQLPQTHGNANQMQQVLMNLMINAQQAMEGHAGTIKITTRHADNGHITVRVSDTGPGIPQEIQSKIFEPFFTTKPAGKGTGLGLSVTYGIIKDHKGEVRLESAPGQGTSFVITLPAMAVASAGQAAFGILNPSLRSPAALVHPGTAADAKVR